MGGIVDDNIAPHRGSDLIQSIVGTKGNCFAKQALSTAADRNTRRSTAYPIKLPCPSIHSPGDLKWFTLPCSTGFLDYIYSKLWHGIPASFIAGFAGLVQLPHSHCASTTLHYLRICLSLDLEFSKVILKSAHRVIIKTMEGGRGACADCEEPDVHPN